MTKFLKKKLRSLGTYLGLEGGLTQPLVIVGFNRLVILITYDMKYFTMDAVSLASILAQNRPSSHMCIDGLSYRFMSIQSVNQSKKPLLISICVFDS